MLATPKKICGSGECRVDPYKIYIHISIYRLIDCIVYTHTHTPDSGPFGWERIFDSSGYAKTEHACLLVFMRRRDLW